MNADFESDQYMIPLVGSVACGAPNIGVEDIEETFASLRAFLRR